MVVEQAKEKAKSAIKEGAKKLIKRFGWGYILEWTPFIGFLVPGDIILVWRTLKGELMGPEAILMLPIATFAYLIKLTIGIIEIWFDLGILTTLITWLIAGFFAAWVFMRGSGSVESKENDREETKKELPARETDQKNPGSPKTPTKAPSSKK